MNTKRCSEYITKSDIAEIIRICKGNWPKMEFLFHLIKYCNPRQHQTFITISNKKLEEWSKDYNKYLDELKKEGIITLK